MKVDIENNSLSFYANNISRFPIVVTIWNMIIVVSIQVLENKQSGEGGTISLINA